VVVIAVLVMVIHTDFFFRKKRKERKLGEYPITFHRTNETTKRKLRVVLIPLLFTWDKE